DQWKYGAVSCILHFKDQILRRTCLIESNTHELRARGDATIVCHCKSCEDDECGNKCDSRSIYNPPHFHHLWKACGTLSARLAVRGKLFIQSTWINTDSIYRL